MANELAPLQRLRPFCYAVQRAVGLDLSKRHTKVEECWAPHPPDGGLGGVSKLLRMSPNHGTSHVSKLPRTSPNHFARLERLRYVNTKGLNIPSIVQ